MDMNTITVLLAIITIVPTVGGIIFQAIKDKRQAELDEKKDQRQAVLDAKKAEDEKERADAQLELDKATAATSATSAATASLSSVIATLQGDNARLNTRVAELEQVIIDKTAKIGELMIAKINAESETATMKYKMETMQLRLNTLQPRQASDKNRRKEDTVPLAIRQTLEENETRKALVQEETDKEIETLKSSSIANGMNYSTSAEGE